MQPKSQAQKLTSQLKRNHLQVQSPHLQGLEATQTAEKPESNVSNIGNNLILLMNLISDNNFLVNILH
jgi:hypothetical protein